MEGWIKLHRRLLTNRIIRDPNALQIFIWLLLKVDRKTGKKDIGRLWASKELGMNPNTFYKAIKRLEKKWQMVTLSSNNQFTEVSLINWYKYQSDNTNGNNAVTTREQRGNTLQEERIKNREERAHTSLEYLLNIPVEDMDELRKDTTATEDDMRSKGEDLYNYCQSKGRTYKNYRAVLRSAIKKDYPPKKNLFPDYKLLKRA